jgi:BirA family biotin operon repressor/biotin-[acetyl-CoA-carboxylase] ligase
MRVSDLSPGSVEPLLLGRLGRPYRFVAECESTQRLLGPEEAEGTTVVAEMQTHGRGRLGRTWEAPAGRALLFSVLLRPAPPMVLWPELSLVAGDAVAAALRAETGVPAELSHPNDVVVEGRKLAGILPEASSGKVVLGIGVNVNQTAEELPDETPKPSTSLRAETGRQWHRGPLVAAILLELEHRYDEWQRLHTNR